MGPGVPDLLLDSDVVIELLRGNERVRAERLRLEGRGWTMVSTPVAKAEIHRGLRRGEEKAVGEFFALCRCLNITEEVGEQAGRYLAAYHRSHGVDIADALVAASARVYGATLFTLNVRHYPMTDLRVHRLK